MDANVVGVRLHPIHLGRPQEHGLPFATNHQPLAILAHRAQ